MVNNNKVYIFLYKLSIDNMYIDSIITFIKYFYKSIFIIYRSFIMKVAVMTDIKKIQFIEANKPKPKDDEVLVKLEYVGVCGSDLHYYEHGAIGDYIVKPPFVLGHECSGTIVEIGSKVKHLKVGIG